ncbi:MAG TPA: nucleoside phosphorylase [Candidatus Nanopelagicaceae bacterium]|nr:nucleoside phosphorylase [Candidatus Nanopelagicaceae bacterium]
MGFPNLAGKHAFEPFVNPDDYQRYLTEAFGWPGLPPLLGVVITFQGRFFRRVVADPAWRRLDAPVSLIGDLYLRETERGLIGILGGFGVGAPAAINRMEDIAASGPRRFLAIGFAGGLQPDLEVGDLVVCDRAIRDEGVSHHYLAPGPYSHPSVALTGRLEAQLALGSGPVRVGTTWTIDTPYRETVDELAHYRDQGVLTVEMEAAALAAVAEFRGLEFATAFTISDQLTGERWQPQFHHEAAQAGLDRLLQAAIATLSAPELPDKSGDGPQPG